MVAGPSWFERRDAETSRRSPDGAHHASHASPPTAQHGQTTRGEDATAKVSPWPPPSQRRAAQYPIESVGNALRLLLMFHSGHPRVRLSVARDELGVAHVRRRTG